MTAPTIDYSFPHRWQAEVLAARPAILPARHFVYPRQAEEVERGALEVMIRPGAPDTVRRCGGTSETAPTPGAPGLASETWDRFLATCALGFRDPVVPTGIWSAPRPEETCVVSGGYAYIIDTTAPERFTMIAYRPVLEVRPAVAEGVLLFVGNRSILAWGRGGQAWESEILSDEGVTITGIEAGILHGLGWELRTDKETPFALEMRTGLRFPSAGVSARY
jgi:hypothetical protein